MSNFLLVNDMGKYSDYRVNILGLFSTLENAVAVLREYHTLNSKNTETCDYLYIREMKMDKKTFPIPYYYGIDREYLNETLKESDFLYMLLDGKIVKYKTASAYNPYINCSLSEFEEKKMSMVGYGNYKSIDCIYFETLSI